jgi:hypothetical protein
MELTFEQTQLLIKSLIETINTKNEEIELNESYGNMLGDVIDQLNDEIASLKTKLKAKASKAPKVIKELKVIKKVGRSKKAAAEAPAKRKLGRPKKVVA